MPLLTNRYILSKFSNTGEEPINWQNFCMCVSLFRVLMYAAMKAVLICRISVCLIRFSVIVATKYYREGNTLGRKMGPGQGGSQSEMGLGGRKYSGRILGPGQGGSQDYFTKKGVRIIHIRRFVFYHVQNLFNTYIYPQQMPRRHSCYSD